MSTACNGLSQNPQFHECSDSQMLRDMDVEGHAMDTAGTWILSINWRIRYDMI